LGKKKKKKKKKKRKKVDVFFKTKFFSWGPFGLSCGGLVALDYWIVRLGLVPLKVHLLRG
jgi:hypothetical protein